MQTSSRGIALIKQFEGFRSKAYRDPVGIWTVGWGSTQGVVPGQVVTEAEAEGLLRVALQHIEGVLNAAIAVPVNQDQFDACACFAYNVGPGNFSRSTLLRKLNGGDLAGAADEFLRWNHAGPQVLEGLTRRREAERALFVGSAA